MILILVLLVIYMVGITVYLIFKSYEKMEFDFKVDSLKKDFTNFKQEFYFKIVKGKPLMLNESGQAYYKNHWTKPPDFFKAQELIEDGIVLGVDTNCVAHRLHVSNLCYYDEVKS